MGTVGGEWKLLRGLPYTVPCLIALSAAAYLFAVQAPINDATAQALVTVALIAGIVFGVLTLAWPDAHAHWRRRRDAAKPRGKYAYIPRPLLTAFVAFGTYIFMTTDADIVRLRSSGRHDPLSPFLWPLLDIRRSHELASWIKMSIYSGTLCYLCAATVIYAGLALTGIRK